MTKRNRLLALITIPALVLGLLIGCGNDDSAQSTTILSSEKGSSQSSVQDSVSTDSDEAGTDSDETDAVENDDIIGEVTAFSATQISLKVYTIAHEIDDYASLDISELAATEDAEDVAIDSDAAYYGISESSLVAGKADDISTGDLVAVTTAEDGSQQIILLKKGAEDAAGDETGTSDEMENVAIIAEPTHYAEIDIEGYGTITVALDGNAAPETVENFVSLAEAGFYDGLTFHRIMQGFMMQGGDPNGNGTGGAENTITGEFSDNGIENPLSHIRGAVSMARSDAYDSASSQFFIVQEDNVGLDGQYAVFGYVTEGMDIVDEICNSAEPTDNNGTISSEQQPVIISIKVMAVEDGTEDEAG